MRDYTKLTKLNLFLFWRLIFFVVASVVLNYLGIWGIWNLVGYATFAMSVSTALLSFIGIFHSRVNYEYESAVSNFFIFVISSVLVACAFFTPLYTWGVFGFISV